MRITFKRDHRGYETQERFFEAGKTADLPAVDARRLIALGWAEVAEKGAAVAAPSEEGPTVSTASTVPLADVPGAAALEDALNEIEIRTAHDLAHATKVFLTRAKGVGEKRAAELQQAARDLLYPEPEPEGEDDDDS